MTKIAINGLGRIGRAFLKLAVEQPDIEVVAANDISDADNLAYLLKFDTVYGRYEHETAIERSAGETWLRIGQHRAHRTGRAGTTRSGRMGTVACRREPLVSRIDAHGHRPRDRRSLFGGTGSLLTE